MVERRPSEWPQATSVSSRKGIVMTHELAIELILDAPAEKLFRCYTDPKLLQKWFAPEPWTIKSVDIDPRAVAMMSAPVSA